MSLLDRFRERKDEFFRTDPHSPLLPDQRDEFDGLTYFPENLDLRFELSIEEFPEQDRITMQTSTGDVQDYVRYGKIRFEVEGQPAELTIYMAMGGGGFFLPFMDATNTEETYGAGRYLEIEPLTGDKFLVDFNLAYNPYCAYNVYWSCPVPPVENRLAVPIRAGEKKPAGTWVGEGL
jgi:uncharacterized protein (DUF1684 family)